MFARDHNRSYATLGTGGKTYLVAGDLRARELRVLRDGVECPSLSPDETRLAFKERSGGLGLVTWHISVLDLETLEAVPLAETRSVDDQVEWLDDEHVLYGLPEGASGQSAAVTDVWSVRADGTGTPSKLLAGAWSPGAVRAAG